MFRTRIRRVNTGFFSITSAEKQANVELFAKEKGVGERVNLRRRKGYLGMGRWGGYEKNLWKETYQRIGWSFDLIKVGMVSGDGIQFLFEEDLGVFYVHLLPRMTNVHLSPRK